MARRGNRDRYDRPSWSERDKNRGKKRTPGPPPAAEREPDRWKQKQRDERFDSLFTDPRKDQAKKKILENVGKDGFVGAVDEYRKDFGMPEDFDVLQMIFENHTDVAVRVEALEKMDAGIDTQADSTKMVFKTRIKLLKMSAREPELKKLAVRIAKARAY